MEKRLSPLRGPTSDPATHADEIDRNDSTLEFWAMNMNDWTYQPEFLREADGTVRRVGPPMYVHKSGARVDIARSPDLVADMLAAEGRHDEADEHRRIASDGATLRAFIERRQAEHERYK